MTKGTHLFCDFSPIFPNFINVNIKKIDQQNWPRKAMKMKKNKVQNNKTSLAGQVLINFCRKRAWLYA